MIFVTPGALFNGRRERRRGSLALRSASPELRVEGLSKQNSGNEEVYINRWEEYSWVFWERGGGFFGISVLPSFCAFMVSSPFS